MNIIVISLGGSVIIPNGFDYKFLENFRKLILRLSKKNKIIICTGGGKIARDYIAVLETRNLSKTICDEIGIFATRLNAKLVSSFIGKCNDVIPTSLKEISNLLKRYDVVVCGGLTPGRTTDGTTAEIASYLGTKTMLNIVDVKGLYDKNPKLYKNAKLIEAISPEDFIKFFENMNEKPGQHFVLDSLAANIAKKNKIKVVIISKDIKNLKNYFNNKKFVGTVIS